MIFPERDMGLFEYAKHLAITWNWRQVGPDTLKIGPYVVRLLPDYYRIIFREWYAWKKQYLPSFPLKDKTILDVGAGCGETALFYYLHGATKVIAVEPEPVRFKVLNENMIRNNWSMEIKMEPFAISMLQEPFDFMKMDGEGCEEQLLEAEALPPCSIEVHSRLTLDKLTSKFPLQILPQRQTWIVKGVSVYGPDNTFPRNPRTLSPQEWV